MAVEVRKTTKELISRGYSSFKLPAEEARPVFNLFEASSAFHSSSYKLKQNLEVDKSLNNLGYVAGSKEKYGDTAPAGEIFRGYSSLDFSACGMSGRDVYDETNVLVGRNQIPDWIPEFGTHLDAAISLFANLSKRLFAEICEEFDAPQSALLFENDNNCSQLRLIHYPPNSRENGGIQVHTDYEFFTFVCATTPGLEVLTNLSEWVAIDCDPDTVCVLAGDCLETWTGGRIKSTSHRVNLGTHERLSLAFFAQLDWGRSIVCLGGTREFVPTLHQAKFAIRNYEHLRNAHNIGLIDLGTEIEEENTFGLHKDKENY